MLPKGLNGYLSVLLLFSVGFFAYSLRYVQQADEAAAVKLEPKWTQLEDDSEPDVSGDPITDPEAEPVVIGWCPDPYGHLSWGHPNVSLAIGSAMFPDRPLVIREMTSQGTPKFEEEGWPDILMCIGHNYNETVLNTRWEGLERFEPSPPTEKWTDGVFWPKKFTIPPHQDRPFLVAVNHEAWGRGPCKKYDIMLDTKTEVMHHGCPSVYFPYAAYSLLERKLTTPQDLILPPSFDAEALLKTKTKFCVFLQSTCFHKKYTHKDVAIRVAFYDELTETYKQCDSLGYCRNTGERPLTYEGIKAGGMDESYLTYLPYKFVIASENRMMDGYFTEKMTGAMLAKAVPIYFGDPFVTSDKPGMNGINKNRIFYLNEFIPEDKLKKLRASKLEDEALIEEARELFRPEFQQAVSVIKKLDTDDKAFINMLKEPFFYGNTMEGTSFDLDGLGEKMRTVLHEYKSYLVE